MSDASGQPARSSSRGAGRLLVFIYGLLAFSATGRASYELTTKFMEAPFPYALSIAAALVYIVATWALATDRRLIAWGAVLFELVGVVSVGISSQVVADRFPAASVWSDFGSGYGYVPLVLPFAGLWWLGRLGRRGADDR